MLSPVNKMKAPGYYQWTASPDKGHWFDWWGRHTGSSILTGNSGMAFVPAPWPDDDIFKTEAVLSSWSIDEVKNATWTSICAVACSARTSIGFTFKIIRLNFIICIFFLRRETAVCWPAFDYIFFPRDVPSPKWKDGDEDASVWMSWNKRSVTIWVNMRKKVSFFRSKVASAISACRVCFLGYEEAVFLTEENISWKLRIQAANSPSQLPAADEMRRPFWYWKYSASVMDCVTPSHR